MNKYKISKKWQKNYTKVDNKVFCNTCGIKYSPEETYEAIQKFKNGSYHIRTTCPKCGSFLKYTPYRDSHTVKKLLDIAHIRGNYNDIPKYVTIYDDTTEEIY